MKLWLSKNKKIILVFLGCLLFLTACTAGSASYDEPAGIIKGFWHGLIAPIMWVFSIFNSDFLIYERYHVRIWYDFGFYIGILGGISFFRKRG